MFTEAKINKAVYLISKHIDIFDLFTEVYIFGSIINSNRHPNDVDLLLVYQRYSKEIQDEQNTISTFLENLFQLPIDITMLSKEELKQTKLLEKLSFKYERLK